VKEKKKKGRRGLDCATTGTRYTTSVTWLLNSQSIERIK